MLPPGSTIPLVGTVQLNAGACTENNPLPGNDLQNRVAERPPTWAQKASFIKGASPPTVHPHQLHTLTGRVLQRTGR